MNGEQQQAYDWAKNQNYQSIAARYARTLTTAVDDLQSQLAAERVKFAELQRYNVDCTKQFGMLQMDKVNLQNLLTESQRRERAALVLYNGRNPDRTMRCSCPACGRLFQEESFVENYCPNCGQRLGRGPQEAGK